MCRYVCTTGVVWLVATFGLTASAFAQEGPMTIYKSADVFELEAICEALGYTSERGTDSADDPMLTIHQGDYVVALLLYDLQDGRAGSIHLRASFEAEVDYEAMSKWNRDERRSRAYVGDDGDAVVENDLDIAGGVTEEMIRSFFARFGESVARFAESLP